MCSVPKRRNYRTDAAPKAAPGCTSVQRGERGEACDRDHLPHIEDLGPGSKCGGEGRACGALSLSAKHAILAGLAVGKREVHKGEVELLCMLLADKVKCRFQRCQNPPKPGGYQVGRELGYQWGENLVFGRQ